MWAVSGAAGGLGAMLSNIIAGAVALAGLALLSATRLGGGGQMLVHRYPGQEPYSLAVLTPDTSDPSTRRTARWLSAELLAVAW